MSGTLFQVSVLRAACNLDGLNRRSAQVPHTYQVVSGSGEREHPVLLKDPAMAHFPQQRDLLQPSETFFDALPLLLADSIAGVARGTCVNGAPASAPIILRHVRCYSQMAAFGHEIRSVISLVPAHCHWLRTRNLLQHNQRSVALRGPISLEYFCVHDQSVSVLHQQIPAVTQLGLLPRALACQSGIGIGLRCMRLIAPILPVKVNRGVARIVRRRSLSVLPLKN